MQYESTDNYILMLQPLPFPVFNLEIKPFIEAALVEHACIRLAMEAVPLDVKSKSPEEGGRVII